MANHKKTGLIKWTAVFDKRIYPAKAVRQAVKDYASLGTLKMQACAGKIKVKAVLPAGSDVHFREEFSNYVLGMAIKCR
jgi:hypothetical protein